MRLSRLRRGELVSAIAALALVVLLSAVTWFARAGHSQTGWQALPGLRWLLLVDVAGGLAIVVTQGACRAPALPASLDVVETVVAFVAAVALAIRIATTAANPGAGAWLGLAAAAVLTAGAFLSLREESGWSPGPDRRIETVALMCPTDRERGA